MNTFEPKIRLAAFLVGASVLASPVLALERLEPAEGCYLGFNLGEDDTIARLGSRLGITPAVHVRFFDFPLSVPGRAGLTNFLGEALYSGGIALITLEPWQGLDPVTENACVDLATLCAAWEQQGIDGIMIRFGHEMNGNWYPWGQRPILYKQKFRLLAQAVHSRTARTALLWAPNYGVGYPFGTPPPEPGSPDFVALDTNRDGVLSQSDDMYEPYYPGDDAVDWVGMTIYHWGVDYPWFENELPLPNSFANSLTGTHQGVTPNFYARYCNDGVHNKPMAIPETSAFYNTQQPGPDEFAIKQAWWQQVFNISGDTPGALDVAVHFQKLKCINWFDHYKPESEAQNNWIDWRISAERRMCAAFARHVRALRNGRPYFLTAPEARWQQSPYAITANGLPQLLPLTGSISFSLNAKAQTACDLVVDLLDENFQWQGGTRVRIAAGTQTVTAAFPLVQPLNDGAVYRWSIFLTPTGGNYQQALAWYRGSPPVARAIVPAIQIVAFPPALSVDTNFIVRVKYTAPHFALVQINLLDANSNWRGGGTTPVQRGDGVVEINVRLQTPIADGNYQLECFLSHSPVNRETAMAWSETLPVQVARTMDQDAICAVPEPPTLPVGDVFRFTVGYAASSNRELHVELYDAEANFLASAIQTVGRGSGLKDMTISRPGVAPGQYLMRAFLTAVGGTSTETLARSTDQTIEVLAQGYQQWIESHWGVVFGNDAITPQDDADGDGASNADEFAAQTDPRNAVDVLKTKIARTGTGLTVSWRSVAGRHYQLFQSSNLSSGVWTPVGSLATGTGATLQVAVGAENAATFYRVHASP